MQLTMATVAEHVVVEEDIVMAAVADTAGDECGKLSWKVQPLSKRRILARLEVAKHGAEPGRLRTRYSHLQALQSIPEDPALSRIGHRCGRWGWSTRWRRNCGEGNIIPLMREVDNPDGSTKTNLRPIALLETLLKLIESSVAVDQNAVQEHQVGCRDGAEAMISAVKNPE